MQTQLNYTNKSWEFYTGVENLLNYTQHKAIIDPENPFGNYFNATEIFAPVLHQTIYWNKMAFVVL